MKRFKGVFSLVMGFCIVTSGIAGVNAANTTDTYFSEYANTDDKLLTYKTAMFPATRDPYEKDCRYYATNEKMNYVAFRRKTDTTSVYLKITSKTSTKKDTASKILLRVVSTYDASGYRTEAQASSLVTGDYLNRNFSNYELKSGFKTWDGGLIPQNYSGKWYTIRNYPGEYELWNNVRDYVPKYDYCALEVTTNSWSDNSWFSGCWSPDTSDSYTVIKN